MRKECVAMILAGGKGSRLGCLTRSVAKPAIPFGGKYKIIDFALSNCANSGIETVGVLTQYEPLELNRHCGNGGAWGLDRRGGGLTILSPYAKENGAEWYKGTANAIYQNIHYIDRFNPKYVIVLSGDHVYKMDYSDMLGFHKEKRAQVTIGVIEVPLNEASRFGIMNTTADNRIFEFEEKPKIARSTKASMGIYIFSWDILRHYLILDEQNKNSSHDFGNDIIPAMLKTDAAIYAYPFNDYWKDVGTIESFWEANMDLISDSPKMNLRDNKWSIYSAAEHKPPLFISDTAKVKRSIIGEGCVIHGEVNNSIVFTDVFVGKGSVISNAIILPNVVIHENAIIERAIVSGGVAIRNGFIRKNSTSRISIIDEEDFEEAVR